MLICQHLGTHTGSANFAALIASFAAQIGRSCTRIRVNWLNQIELQSLPSFLKTFLLRRIPTLTLWLLLLGLPLVFGGKEVSEKSKPHDVGLYAFSVTRTRDFTFRGGGIHAA